MADLLTKNVRVMVELRVQRIAIGEMKILCKITLIGMYQILTRKPHRNMPSRRINFIKTERNTRFR